MKTLNVEGREMTAEEAVKHIIAEADERSVNSERVVHKMEIGQFLRQGDVYIHRVAEDHPHGEKMAEGRVQIAVGETVGQRHFVEGDLVAYMGTTPPPWCAPGTFVGPLIVVRTGRMLNTHPEHAHSSYPVGMYQITHQMDVRTLQRVVD